MTELDCLLTLNAIDQLGNIRIKKLIEHFGSAQNVLKCPPADLNVARIVPSSVAGNIIRFRSVIDLDKEYALIKKYGVKIITCEDDQYPVRLREIPDSPVILYVKGNLPAGDHLAVAMVGSRKASIYGLTMAEKLSAQLAELGIVVVSGLARGVDAACHRGALKAKGVTVAVLGCGLSRVYPPENKELFEKVIEGGAAVSEFAMATPPAAGNFPRRNRIISGLSLGVVVVEASEKSGALITARFALEQGREVFAIPGKIDSPTSRGVNNLIKQGAKLVSGLEDIIEELAPQIQHHLKEHKRPSGLVEKRLESDDLTVEEKSLYQRISDNGIHIDELANVSGFSVSCTMAALLRLEVKHKIKQLPGKFFVRSN